MSGEHIIPIEAAAISVAARADAAWTLASAREFAAGSRGMSIRQEGGASIRVRHDGSVAYVRGDYVRELSDEQAIELLAAGYAS
jgi:hypothetical protein